MPEIGRIPSHLFYAIVMSIFHLPALNLVAVLKEKCKYDLMIMSLFPKIPADSV